MNTEPNGQPHGSDILAAAAAEPWTPVPTGNTCEISCPGCSARLSYAMVGEHKIACCEQCGGMLFQRSNLGRAIGDLRSQWTRQDVTPEPLDTRPLELKRHCPVCYGEMTTFNYCGPGNVIIDACDGCDVTWLDGGELLRLIQSPGLRKPWNESVSTVYGSEISRGHAMDVNDLSIAHAQSESSDLPADDGPITTLLQLVQLLFR